MKKNILNDYCKWVFEFENRIKDNNTFHFSFNDRVSELLLDVYMNNNKLYYKEFKFVDIKSFNCCKKETSFLKASLFGNVWKEFLRG